MMTVLCNEKAKPCDAFNSVKHSADLVYAWNQLILSIDIIWSKQFTPNQMKDKAYNLKATNQRVINNSTQFGNLLRSTSQPFETLLCLLWWQSRRYISYLIQDVADS